MNGASTPTSTRKYALAEILHPELLEYAEDAAIPFGLDKPLNATEVGRYFFEHDKTPEWDIPDVKEALVKLAEIGIDSLRLDDFAEFVTNASPELGELHARERFLGTILLLDQASRHLCKGVNERYVYHFFETIAIYMIKRIIGHGKPARLTDWEIAGIDKNQAIIRMFLFLAPLAHSEVLVDHDFYLRMAERLRKEYESITRTTDPYRESFFRDLENVDLYGQMRASGPPQGKLVHMHDLVYWMMRYHTSHIAWVRYFGRSPLRNMAVGRDDTEGETEWLTRNGFERNENDEVVRKMVREDIENARRRPLLL